jgi:uncharacterized protein (TIGR01777 family)
MNPTGRVVIAGGTGFLGTNLAGHLHGLGYDVVVLSRNSPARQHPWRHQAWDARTLGDWVAALDGATALVNLAGRSVDCIKTPDHADEILRSRVESTTVLGQAMRTIASRPRVWVQMATTHRYGDPLDLVIDEDSAFGYGLAPFVAGAWEEAFERAVPADVRPVVLRTSFVLGAAGGFLPRLNTLVKWWLGGQVGHGRQGISWIHEADMNAMFAWAIADERVRGAYLATAPNPVTNAVFMRELRDVMGVPFGLPAAEWMVRLGAPLLMNTDPELPLYGRLCVSRRLREEGFVFRFPELRGALNDLYAPKSGDARS